MSSKAEAYEFLLQFCRERVDGIEDLMDGESWPELEQDLGRWQACVELLESECPFHMKLLEQQ